MTTSFRPALKAAAKLLIGIYATSGCGKTYSALLLARGFVGPSGRIGMIETESGRGEIYVDAIPGGYSVLPMHGNFSPRAFGDAIKAAEDEKFDALIIDSASHEWESIGGVLDMAAENEKAGKKGPLVWQKPKIEHQKFFVSRMMNTPIPLVIVCMRAKYPMEQETKPNGQKGDWRRSTKLEPKQSEDILFEMLAHGWISDDHNFHVTKYPKVDRQFAGVLVDGEPLSIATGERLSAWSKTRGAAPPARIATDADEGREDRITAAQIDEITSACKLSGVDVARVLKRAQIDKLSDMPSELFGRALSFVLSAKREDPAAGASDAPGVTFADVSAAMNKAGNADDLEIAGDLIRSVKNGDHQEELRGELLRLREKFAQ